MQNKSVQTILTMGEAKKLNETLKTHYKSSSRSVSLYINIQIF